MPARANEEAIGLDVGGTKINAFRVARDGMIVERSSTTTPADDEAATLSPSVKHLLVLKRLGRDVPWTAGRDQWWHGAQQDLSGRKSSFAEETF